MSVCILSSIASCTGKSWRQTEQGPIRLQQEVRVAEKPKAFEETISHAKDKSLKCRRKWRRIQEWKCAPLEAETTAKELRDPQDSDLERTYIAGFRTKRNLEKKNRGVPFVQNHNCRGLTHQYWSLETAAEKPKLLECVWLLHQWQRMFRHCSVADRKGHLRLGQFDNWRNNRIRHN